jgi:hypothetical protein
LETDNLGEDLGQLLFWVAGAWPCCISIDRSHELVGAQRQITECGTDLGWIEFCAPWVAPRGLSERRLCVFRYHHAFLAGFHPVTYYQSSSGQAQQSWLFVSRSGFFGVRSEEESLLVPMLVFRRIGIEIGSKDLPREVFAGRKV